MRDRLHRLYPAEEVETTWPRLQARLDAARERLPPNPHAKLWSEEDAILITYGDSVRREGERPLRCLCDFVREYLGEAVSMVHLLPFFPFPSDDGFSISDYEKVRPDLGSWADIAALGRTHDLMYDLVLNHCSASHEWFQQFLADQAPGRAYFHSLDPDTDVSLVVRPRTHPLLSPFETAAGKKWVWTTFSADQVDLNFGNPEVLLAFVDLLLLYVERGARVIRLDAIAYLWKTLGTTCIHLPQTHEVVKLMRDVLDEVAPGVILLTETNVPHEENVSYFGEGDEARMVYQFPLPPLLLHALRRGDASRLTAWAAALDAPPAGCTFFNFTASHDGIGVRPLEGLVPMDEVKEMAAEIKALGGKVNERSHADGSTTPYELNCTYFSALKNQGDDAETHLRRFLLSQTLPMCLQGVPAFYLHSFTATENDLEGMARTGQNRSINRKQWSWNDLREALSGDAVAARVLSVLVERLRLRSGIPEFHPDVPQRILRFSDTVFAVRRGGVTALHQLGEDSVWNPISAGELLWADEGVSFVGDGLILPGLSACWLRDPAH